MGNKIDSSIVERAVEKVDRNYLIETVTKLVNVPSPTGSEADMAEAYHEVLTDIGFRSTLQHIGDGRYNTIGVRQGAGGGKSLMFNGHMDTSFGPELSDRGIGYKTEVTLVDDEWIYGMGSFNMKSALAAYAAASKAISDAGIKLAGDIVIAGVAGEIEKAPVEEFQESKYHGLGAGTKFALAHGAVADYCILGEPTAMKIVPGHCGSTWLRISVPGHLIHTAWSNIDDNAINHARHILDALVEWIPQYIERNADGKFKPNVNIASIDGGWKWRGARTPDFCKIYLDVRTMPDVLPVEAYREVRDLVDSVVEKHPELEGTIVETYVSQPGTAIPDDHELIEHITAAHREELGEAPEHLMEVWTSDAGHMNHYGIPTVNYGSAGRIRSGGDGFSTHQGEHIHIGDLVDMTRIYTRCILSICGVAECN